DHPPGLATPGGDRSPGHGPGVHAVRYNAGKPDKLGDPDAPVDWVDVSRVAGVPYQIRPRHSVGLWPQLLSRLHVGHPSPRTTSRDHTGTTGSPASVVTSVRVAMKSCPPRDMMSSIVLTQTRRSPARTGRV